MRDSSIYFDRVANDYEDMSKRGIMGWLKRKERACILDFLKKVGSGRVILDAGCGNGYYSHLLSKRGWKVIGVDKSINMVKEAKKRGIDVVRGDIYNIAFKIKFDGLLCIGVSEFCEDFEIALSNLMSHVRRGGWMILLLPRFNFWVIIYFLYHISHGILIRISKVSQLEKIIVSKGFEIICVKKPTPISQVMLLRRTDDNA